MSCHQFHTGSPQALCHTPSLRGTISLRVQLNLDFEVMPISLANCSRVAQF